MSGTQTRGMEQDESDFSEALVGTREQYPSRVKAYVPPQTLYQHDYLSPWGMTKSHSQLAAYGSHDSHHQDESISRWGEAEKYPQRVLPCDLALLPRSGTKSGGEDRLRTCKINRLNVRDADPVKKKNLSNRVFSPLTKLGLTQPSYIALQLRTHETDLNPGTLTP